MPAQFISGEQVTGSAYVVPAGTDRQMLYMVTGENSGFASVLTNVTYGGQAMTPIISDVIDGNQLWVHVFMLNEAGIVAATDTSFIETWSSGTVTDTTFACTLSGVHQGAPINAQSLTTHLSNDPVKPTVSVGDNGLLFELVGSGGTVTNWTWTNFIERVRDANSGKDFAIATQEVVTSGLIQTEFDDGIIARSYLAAIAFNEANLNPYVTNFVGAGSGADSIYLGELGLLSGANFEGTRNSGVVILSPTTDINDVNAYTVTTYSGWTDGSIFFMPSADANLKIGTLYAFVRNNSGLESAALPITLLPKQLKASNTIQSISPLGIYKDITGIELGADIVEYDTVSSGGGTVTVLLSGIAEIAYSSTVPDSDTFGFRIFDDSLYEYTAISTATVQNADKTGSGTIAAQDAISSGSGERSVTGSGTIAAQDAISSGSGERSVTGSGAVTAEDSTVIGQAGLGPHIAASNGSPPAVFFEEEFIFWTLIYTTYSINDGTPSIDFIGSDLPAGLNNTQVSNNIAAWQGTPSQGSSGDYTYKSTMTTEYGVVSNEFTVQVRKRVTGTGVVAADESTVYGSGTLTVTGPGTAEAQESNVAGAGFIAHTGSGSADSQPSIVDGASVSEYTYTADNTNYTAIVAGATSSEVVGLEAGIYTGGLAVPSGVTVKAIDGLGSVYFTQGSVGISGSNGIILLENTGSTVDGIIAHTPTDDNSHGIMITGDGNSLLNCIGYNGGNAVHKIPCFVSGNNNLVEDSGFFGVGRYSFQIFTATGNTIRRVIARWDSTVINNLTQPNATFSNYNANSTTWENCVAIDYNATPDEMNYGGCFYSPHNQGVWPIGNRDNGWYGCIVAHHDRTNDALPLGENNQGFRSDTTNPTNLCVDNVVRDFYVRDTLRDIQIYPYTQYEFTDVTRVDVDNITADGTFGDGGRSSMTAGSGADIDVQYIDGVKTATPLWPFKNEDIIKAEMLNIADGNRGWAASNDTLEEYVKGTGSTISSGSGSADSQTADVSGAGLRLVTGSGSADSAPANAVGSGDSGGVSTGDGAPSAQTAAASGTGLRLVTGSGTSDSENASASGTGESVGVSTGSGTPNSETATVSGTGLRLVTGSGTSDAQTSTASGTGLRLITGTGSAIAEQATSSGTADFFGVFTGTGEVSADDATVSGTGIRIGAGIGSLEAEDAACSGVGLRVVSGSGDVSADVANIYQTPPKFQPIGQRSVRVKVESLTVSIDTNASKLTVNVN